MLHVDLFSMEPAQVNVLPKFGRRKLEASCLPSSQDASFLVFINPSCRSLTGQNTLRKGGKQSVVSNLDVVLFHTENGPYPWASSASTSGT
ncbi:hypothetical protein CK203_096303 [Vitis vinifera]|uniref:Uncharacterized protein n=1 Tax=Vitis vinifera TaxID=29760 RepID=A0A438FCA1_VITVI|nr:hypothetical protein CK203_096303 [Vitis vinifera]